MIFYTAACHEREARSRADQCGVAAILTKPSHPDAILETIAALLNQAPRPVTAVDAQAFDREHLEVVSWTLAARKVELKDVRHRMSALIDVARQVAPQRDPDALLRQVCSAARDVTLAQASRSSARCGRS